jgi:trans-aconitate methyltransferase
MGDAPRWNANLHAFDALLRRVPSPAVRGLDVGCGEGETARRLRARVPSVVAIDPHEPSVLEARSRGDTTMRATFGTWSPSAATR